MIYVITGHLGSGKSLMAVTLAVEEYLAKGRRVASNMTLFLDNALPGDSKTTAIKLPAIPTVEHLDALGTGYDISQGYDESKFGFLLLDEAGTWLNSRDWNDKGRRGLFRWITHARKLGWDVGLIVQDFEALDTQIRRSVTEIYVTCRRMDRIKVPYLPIRLPKLFLAICKYGSATGAHFKTFTGRPDAFDWYDTRESVHDEWFEGPDGEPVDSRAISTMLSAWHLRGRYQKPKPSFSERAWLLAALILLGALGALLGVFQGRPIGAAIETVGAISRRAAARGVARVAPR